MIQVATAVVSLLLAAEIARFVGLDKAVGVLCLASLAALVMLRDHQNDEKNVGGAHE